MFDKQILKIVKWYLSIFYLTWILKLKSESYFIVRNFMKNKTSDFIVCNVYFLRKCKITALFTAASLGSSPAGDAFAAHGMKQPRNGCVFSELWKQIVHDWMYQFVGKCSIIKLLLVVCGRSRERVATELYNQILLFVPHIAVLFKGRWTN